MFRAAQVFLVYIKTNWFIIIRVAQGFRVVLYNTFWILLKLSAAQNRVAQIRVAQGLTVLDFHHEKSIKADSCIKKMSECLQTYGPQIIHVPQLQSED